MAHLLKELSRIYEDQIILESANINLIKAIEELFPFLNEEEGHLLKELTMSLKEIVSNIADFVSEKSNLQSDRAIASSALSYLIMPVDLLPDEGNGLVGYLDDAILTFHLLENLEAPSQSITKWLDLWRETVSKLDAALPDWFTDSIEEITGNILQQVQAMRGAWLQHGKR